MKTNFMKKAGALLTAAAIAATTVLSGASMVSAEGNASTMPVLSATNKGSLHITKYISGTPTGDGVGAPATGLEQTLTGGIKVEGVKYTAYKVNGVINNGVMTADSYPDAPITVDDEETPTKITDANGKEFTIEAEAVATGLTNTTGEFNFEFNESNVYVIIEDTAEAKWTDSAGDKHNEDAGNNSLTAAKPFLVSVPMTNPANESEWLTEVYIYPKNDNNTPIKTVDDPSVLVGEKHTFSLFATIPASGVNAGKEVVLKYVNFKDNLESAFDLTKTNTSDIKVYYTTEDKEKASDNVKLGVDPAGKTPLKPGTDYTITSRIDDDSADSFVDGPTVKVSLTEDGIWKLYGSTDGTGGITVNKTVYVELPVVTNKKILEEATQTVGNKFTTDIRNDGEEEVDDKDKPTSPEIYVHTGNIEITKKDEEGVAIEGVGGKIAEFAIADTKQHAEAGKYLQVIKEGDKITKILKPGDDGYDDDDEAENFYKVSTGTGGIATFTGLDCCTFYETYTDPEVEGAAEENNVTVPNSYWIVETKAPDGYNLLTAPVKVSFDVTNHSKKAGNQTVTTKELIKTTISVVDTKGVTLPVTGGIGIIIFVVAGVVLLGAAILIGISPKKKSAAK